MNTFAQPAYDEHVNVTFSTPYLYSGIVFSGIPEYVACADNGDLVGSSSDSKCQETVICVGEGSRIRNAVIQHIVGTSGRADSVTDTNVVRGRGGRNGKYQWFIDGICNVIATQMFDFSQDIVNGMGYTGPFTSGSQILSKEPIAMVTKVTTTNEGLYDTHDDSIVFSDFVNWIFHALITASDRGITQTTSHLFPTSGAASGSRIFGEEYANMFANAIAAVGNYNEIYARFVGPQHITNKDLLLNKINALNNAYTGLMYAIPFGDITVPDDWTQDDISNMYPRPIPGGTLEKIQSRGSLQCGIVGGRPGFAEQNDDSLNAGDDNWIGIAADYCRGLGAAVTATGSSRRVSFVEYDTFEDAFVGLADKEVDVLAGAPCTMINDVNEPTTGQGYAFGPIYYYGVFIDEDSFAMATRQSDDPQFSDFVKWMTYATIYAEEKGIQQDNAAERMPLVDLFGVEYQDSFQRMIQTTGNYAELYRRNLERYIPRSGRNLLSNGTTPQFNPMWEF